MRVVLDTAVLAISFWLAYMLRFDFDLPRGYVSPAIVQASYVIALQLVALLITGIYSFIWRYVGLAEIRAFLQAASIATFPLLFLRLVLPEAAQVWRVPLSVTLADAFIGFSGLIALRVARRVAHERLERRRRAIDSPAISRVLLIGAGQAGVLAASEIMRRGDTGLEVVGFVDDDREKVGTMLHGVRVVGTTSDLVRLVRDFSVDSVIITIAQAPRAQITRIVELCNAIPIKARIIPGLYELLQGTVEISRIRNVEIEDLLGREPVRLDVDDIAKLLTGKVVMVTGAGGSIGSELSRQIARFSPAKLLLVERAEFALFEIDRELCEIHKEIAINAVVADISDGRRMSDVFRRHSPQVIIHAAAHKHVPLMEQHPCEAVRNNAFGTKTVAELAADSGCEVFVLVSTDKAVNPSSIMGASKRVAELIVQDLSRRRPETRFVAVRFGNVMGSAGSVIPIFRRQIAAGGPVTVTHPDMMRYFMTIPEASQLVLQAAAIGAGGEVFVLDMGDPVRIVDLAAQMIKLSGLRPGDDIRIEFSGIRPGEKLFEELDRSDEALSKTKHPKIYNGNVNPGTHSELAASLAQLDRVVVRNDDVEARSILSRIVPEARLSPASEQESTVPDFESSAPAPQAIDKGGRVTR